MHTWSSILFYLLALSLAACETADVNIRVDDSDTQSLVIEQDTSPEDLYFELRQLLAATLRRTHGELQRSEDRALLEAREGQTYARRLHRAGVREAHQYAEGTLLIAGMMGVPTSEGDVVLMVAVPVGGYVVVKVAGVALKRVPFLLRKFRTADEVVDGAKTLGLHPRYAATQEELRALAGDAAAKAANDLPSHVGAGSGQQGERLNPWNPSNSLQRETRLSSMAPSWKSVRCGRRWRGEEPSSSRSFPASRFPIAPRGSSPALLPFPGTSVETPSSAEPFQLPCLPRTAAHPRGAGRL